MRKTPVQRLAFVSIILLIILIFAGAIVRVTGSGLGCPDWPTCWGQLVPPFQVEQVDRDKLAADIPRFQKAAERFGRDPSEITVDSLLEEFDGTQTWIEFINRLLALPVLLANFLLMLVCVRTGILKKQGVAAFALVIISALTGIIVVASGLHAGVVTIHMALAFLQLFLLAYMVWAGGEKGTSRSQISGCTRGQVMLLLVCVIIEWALGSQIREMTDRLQMEKGIDSRASWIHEISESFIYLTHRSFSWSILLTSVWLVHRVRWTGLIPRLVLAVVIALMIMGLILSTTGIHAVVQVLHVGLSGILVTAVFYWWLSASPSNKGGRCA